MRFLLAMFAISALVGAGAAAAIAPRGNDKNGGGGYRCSGCNGDTGVVICLSCDPIDILGLF